MSIIVIFSIGLFVVFSIPVIGVAYYVIAKAAFSPEDDVVSVDSGHVILDSALYGSYYSDISNQPPLF